MTLLGIKTQIDGKTVVLHPSDVEFVYSEPMTTEELQAALAITGGYYVKVGEGPNP